MSSKPQVSGPARHGARWVRQVAQASLKAVARVRIPSGLHTIAAGQRLVAPVAGTAGGCHFCPWATAVQQQLRLVSQKLAIGAGGLLVREQGALTRYRRCW